MKKVTPATEAVFHNMQRIQIYKIDKRICIDSHKKKEPVTMCIALIEAYKQQYGEAISPDPISVMDSFITAFPEMSEIRPKDKVFGDIWWSISDFISRIIAFDVCIEKAKAALEATCKLHSVVAPYPFDDCN